MALFDANLERDGSEQVVAERFILRLTKLPGGSELAAAIEQGDVAAVAWVARGMFARAFTLAGIPVLLIEAIVAWYYGYVGLTATILLTASITTVALLLTWRRAVSPRTEALLHMTASTLVLGGGLPVVLIYQQPAYVLWGVLYIPIAYYFLGSRRGFIAITGFGLLAAAVMMASPSLGWVTVPVTLLREIIIAYVAFALLLGVFQLTSEAFESAAILLAARLEQLADTDALTGVYNRRRLTSELQQRVAEFNRSGVVLGLILLDIDRFKRINDQHGHQVGDEVLRRLADVLHSGVRESDVVGRWGGEEFLLLLPCTAAFGAGKLAEKLRAEIAALEVCGVDTITASFGIATCQPGDNIDLLIDRADQALYRAKQAGRNRVESEAGESNQMPTNERDA